MPCPALNLCGSSYRALQQAVERAKHSLGNVKGLLDVLRLRVKNGWVPNEPSGRSEMVKFGRRRRHHLECCFSLFENAVGSRVCCIQLRLGELLGILEIERAVQNLSEGGCIKE